MSDRALLICGNGLSGESIPQIRSWGYRVGVITEFPCDVGCDAADHLEIVPSKQPEQAMAAAQRLRNKGFHFEGVISLCWDCAVSVSTIAAAYGLRSPSVRSAEVATDKVLRSRRLKAHGVAAPAFWIVTSEEALKSTLESVTFPIVCKPNDQSSSKGVMRADTREEARQAFAYAQKYSRSRTVVVNEFIHGPEHSSEGLMIDGRLHLTGLSDRMFRIREGQRTFVEIGDHLPTGLSSDRVRAVETVTERAALALGIRDGIVKGDIILDPQRGPMVLELAARLGGPRP